MSEFGYLSVLLAIILSLAITQLLQGWRGRMLHRDRVKDYWPTHAWSGLLLLICTQYWWAMFVLRDRVEWTFAQFALLLAQTILIYLGTALVYPDFSAGEAVDLRAHYFSQRKHFFGVLAATALVSILRDTVLFHGLPSPVNLAFLSFYAVAAFVGAFAAREWLHKAMVLFVAVVFVFYIVWFFSRLR